MYDRIVLETAGMRVELFARRDASAFAHLPLNPALRAAVFRVPWSATLVQMLARAGAWLDPAVRRDPRFLHALRVQLWSALSRGQVVAAPLVSSSYVAPAPQREMSKPAPVAWDADAPEDSAPTPAPPLPEGSEEEAENDPTKHWIEIELVSDDDRPLAGRRYRLELPDGSIREGRFDDKGFLRVEGIDPGSCSLTLPTDDESEWLDALEPSAA